MSYAMVSKYGMSDKIGYVGYVENEYSKSYSDATNKVKKNLNIKIKILK
jgi:AFG3 family protein